MGNQHVELNCEFNVDTTLCEDGPPPPADPVPEPTPSPVAPLTPSPTTIQYWVDICKQHNGDRKNCKKELDNEGLRLCGYYDSKCRYVNRGPEGTCSYFNGLPARCNENSETLNC